MSERTYIPARGFPIDATNFQRHQQTCKACAGFNSDNPASLSVLCLDGAVLLEGRERAADEARSSTYASRAEVRRLMRYK